MKKILALIASAFALTACVTMSGNYTLAAYDANGKELSSNFRLTAQGSGIYSMRNSLCSTYPKAVVVITDMSTGKELEGESPYQCR